MGLETEVPEADSGLEAVVVDLDLECPGRVVGASASLHRMWVWRREEPVRLYIEDAMYPIDRAVPVAIK